jgi:predicted amidophosphoribosyltransferase
MSVRKRKRIKLKRMRKPKTGKKGFKRYKGWCDGCDRNIVSKGAVCEVCGRKSHPEKIQRPTKKDILKELDK